MRTLLFSLLLLATPAFADTIKLEWTAPTTDTSGAPLKSLTGYKLYLSTKSGTYTSPYQYISGAVTNASVVKTTPGTYYAVVSAYNASGESDKSNEVTFQVVVLPPGKPLNLKLK